MSEVTGVTPEALAKVRTMTMRNLDISDTRDKLIAYTSSGLLAPGSEDVRNLVRLFTPVTAEQLTSLRAFEVVMRMPGGYRPCPADARSFGAVSEKFDSPLVPLVADGMIIACTALRLAALTRGWRIPGARVTTTA